MHCTSAKPPARCVSALAFACRQAPPETLCDLPDVCSQYHCLGKDTHCLSRNACLLRLSVARICFSLNAFFTMAMVFALMANMDQRGIVTVKLPQKKREW